MIKHVVDHFQMEFIVESKIKNWLRSVLTLDQVSEISIKVAAFSVTLLRKIALQMDIHQSSAHLGLKELKWYTYATLVRELKPPDLLRHLKFWRWIKNFVHTNGIIFLNNFFSEKAWFHHIGYISASNYTCWFNENTMFIKKPDKKFNKFRINYITSRMPAAVVSLLFKLSGHIVYFLRMK